MARGSPQNGSGPEGTACPGKGGAAAALASLDQVFSLSSLYPAGHDRFGRAAARFREDMEALDLDSLAIEMGEECLRLGAEEVPADNPRLARLHTMLKELGLQGLVFDPAFKQEDLHRFATLLQRLRHGALISKGFSQLDFSHLPETIKVRQREFGSFFKPRLGVAGKGAAPEAATGAKGSLDTLLETILSTTGEGEGGQGSGGRSPAGGPAAGGAGDGGKRATPAEAIITRVFTRLVERVGLEKKKTGSPFHRSIEEVMELDVPILQETIAGILRGEEGAACLDEVVEMVEKALALTRDSGAVGTLLEVMREAAGGKEPAKGGGARQERKREEIPVDPEELRRIVADYTAGVEPIHRLAAEDQGEFLALLGGILLADPAGRVVTGACHQLRKAAAGGLEPLEVSALVKTTREILGRNDPGLVDRTLPGIMRALRPAKGDCLAAFVAELCRLSTTTELLWPHLVNELLMGLEGRDRRERRLFHTMAAGLPEKTMERNLSRLEGLPALAQGQLAKSIFDPPESTLFPLYAILLGTAQGEVIGGLLCKGLSSRKPSWPGMEALKFISHFQPHHAELLAGLLREDQVEEKSYALRESACALINEGLLSLAPGERDQGWIIGPIQALGSLQIEEGRRSLGRIVSQRKWVVFPAWPAPCREEAKRALHRLAVGSDREGRA